MADNYDPDEFDWGDGTPGIPLDDLGENIVEEAVMAALNAHEHHFGWRYLKRSERREGAGRLYRVPYYMPKEGISFFEENFPGYTFVWDGAMGHHDHPISHLCRELNEIEMVEQLIRENKQYIDLFGDGKRNTRYRRNAITLYSKKTPKDYIRYQNPGPSEFEFDLEKLCDPTHPFGKIKDITVTHALYYLHMEMIGRIVSLPGRKLRALIHRHSGTHGLLNGGEQEYWVGQDLGVTQVNVATGEKYVHPSLEALFHQTSAKTSFGGVAWTIKAAGGDSFILEFVSCPNTICEEYIPLRLYKQESWTEHKYSNITVKKFLHWTWMSATTAQGKILIEDTELFDKLRRYVAGKQRTPRLKTETNNYARRLCNKADIISIHGGGAHEIPVASMTDYVEVAFYVDTHSELDAALSFHRENIRITEALNAYYEKGTMPKDMSLVTGAAVMTCRTFSEHAISIMKAVRSQGLLTAEEYIRLNLPGDEAARALFDTGDPGGLIPGPWW